MNFNIGDVVRLKEDFYYDTNRETDHVRIQEINGNGRFNGTGICEGKYFSNLNPDEWERTLEK
jgi:hypothetical protein